MKEENQVLKLIEKSLDIKKLKVIKVEYVKEGRQNFLRIYIDTDNIDECVKATKIINPILDKENIIEEQYILEVTSRGVEE